MSSSKKRKVERCPKCGETAVLPIMYGMPAFDPGPDVIIGGCIIDDADATKRCTKCGWDNSRYPSRFPVTADNEMPDDDSAGGDEAGEPG